MCYSSSCVSKTRSRPRGVYLGLSATHRGRYMPKSRGTGKPANPSPPGRKSVQGSPRPIKPVHLQWGHRAHDGAILAQAPHAALLPSRRLKSTRPIAVGPPATAAALAPADCLSDGLCCGHLGRLSGASQRLGRASFTHAATTGTSGPGVEPWCELHVRGGRGDSRSTRRTSKLAVGVLSWRERETAAEEPSAVASQKLPGSPSGGSCPF